MCLHARHGAAHHRVGDAVQQVMCGALFAEATHHAVAADDAVDEARFAARVFYTEALLHLVTRGHHGQVRAQHALPHEAAGGT